MPGARPCGPISRRPTRASTAAPGRSCSRPTRWRSAWSWPGATCSTSAPPENGEPPHHIAPSRVVLGSATGGRPYTRPRGVRAHEVPRRPMSGLFRRLSSRRSAGPDGLEPPAQAEPGTADAPTTAPTEPGGHESLLTDPAAATPEASQPEPAPAVVHPLVEA